MWSVILAHGYQGGCEYEERPESPEALLGRIEELLAVRWAGTEAPLFTVELFRRDGDLPIGPTTLEYLSVGLGDGGWWVTYWPGENKGPPLGAVGDESAEGKCVIWYGMDSIVWSRRVLMPRAVAHQVIRTWCEAGVLSDVVGWTEHSRDQD